MLTAVVNTRVVQSALGLAASRYFSVEWGGKVQVSRLCIGPLGRVDLRGVELISPDNDTILMSEELLVTFHGNPLRDGGLSLDRVVLTNTYYHLRSLESGGINMKYIFKYFNDRRKPKEESEEKKSPFVVHVKLLHLNNVEYKMDLKGRYKPVEHGVCYKHQHYTAIRARFKDVRVEGPDIACRIVKFSAHERSGFDLLDMSADVHVSPYMISAQNMELNTGAGTHLLFDAMLRYDTWKGMNPYCDKVQHDVTFKSGSVASLKDAAYWAPVLWGFEQKVSLEGMASGPICDLVVNGMHFDIEDLVSFDVDGTVTGLPHIDSTKFDTRISNLRTSYDGMSAIKWPERWHIPVPKVLAPFSSMNVDVELVGTSNNCVASVVANTNLGSVDVQFNTRMAASEHDGAASPSHLCAATVTSAALQLGDLGTGEWLSHTGLDLQLQAEGKSMSSLSGNVDGSLTNTVVRGRAINNTELHAVLQSDLADITAQISDTKVAASLHGVMRGGGSNSYTVDVDLRRLALTSLGLVQSDSAMTASTHLRANLRGQNIDGLSGSVSLSKSRITHGSDTLAFNSAIATITQIERRKSITLNSDFCAMSMRGWFAFSDLPMVVDDFRQKYLSFVVPNSISTQAEAGEMPDVKLNARFEWNTSEPVFAVLGIPLAIAKNSHVNVNYNTRRDMHFVIKSDSIGWGTLLFEKFGLRGDPCSEGYIVSGEAAQLLMDDKQLLDGVALEAQLNSNASLSDNIGSIKLVSRGNEMARLSDFKMGFAVHSDAEAVRFRLQYGLFSIANTPWNFTMSDAIVVDKRGISVPHFTITDHSQWLSAQLQMGSGYDDDIQLAFNDFSLSWLANIVLQDKGYGIDGNLNGTMAYSYNDSTRLFNTNLTLDNCQINDYMLGRITLNSRLDDASNCIVVDIDSRTPREAGAFSPLSAKGVLRFGGEAPCVDVDLVADGLPLSIIEPMIGGAVTGLEGAFCCNAHVGGTTKSLRADGIAVLQKCAVVLQSTNVRYMVDDTIVLRHDSLIFNDFRLSDMRGNTCSLDGAVCYSHFDDLRFQLAVASDRFMLYNIPISTEQTSGTLFASFNGSVDGTLQHPHVAVAATTLRGSTLSVPVSDRRQATEQQFINFYQPQSQTDIVRRGKTEKKNTMPLSLSLEVNITPNLQLMLPVDFSQITGLARTSGMGSIRLEMQPQKPLSLTGGYELTSGSMQVEMFSLLSTSFNVDAGSTITLPGSLDNLTFNISASRTVRANLASLMGTSIESAARTVNVDDVIKLSGTPSNPSVGFDIRFQAADKAVRDEVAGYIDFSNEREVFTQAISLLLTGQFSNTSTEGGEGSSLADNASASGYNLMASSLAAMVGNVIQGVDVNFGYQAETDLTTQQFDVDIRKEWDRLYFESTFGYGGEARVMSGTTDGAASTSNIVGDVLVGYKINPRFHLFVFNRTNTNDYTRTELPYKQGLGLKLTRDFDRWRDIFGRSK